jgi:sortase A
VTSTQAPPISGASRQQSMVVDAAQAPPITETSRRSSSLTVIAAVASLSVAILAGWFAFYGLVLTSFVERGAQFRLYGQLRSELAEETAPLGGAITPGSPVAILTVPGLGLRNAVVVEGSTSAQLTSGPGHLRDTPLPGQPGLSVIFGRSTTFGAPFARLVDLKRGQIIRITTGQGSFSYRVDRMRRHGPPARPVLAPGVSELTLVSSAADGWRTGWAPNKMVLVDASLVKGQVQRAPAGLPSSVTRASQPMEGQTPPLIPLFLWLAGLLAAPVLAIWGWRRWGRWQMWIAGLPIVVALLWGATRSAQLLLPNLI